MDHITIRPYYTGDAEFLVHLFFDSVRKLGRVKYDEAQVQAWAPCIPSPSEWATRMSTNETFVAERSGNIVGFLELEHNGHLNMLYRIHDDTGKGAAEALYRVAEIRARELGISRIYTEASLVAESFFTRHGYSLDLQESIERNGISLLRARMSKVLLDICK